MLKKVLNLYRRRFWPAEKYLRYKGVTLGNNCLISTKNVSSEGYLITVGNYVRLAAGVTFFTHGGLWSQRHKHPGLNDYFGKISVGDYTYIGEGAMIMPGVHIGSDVIVGAGSVVTKSIPDGLIVAGNPCRVVGNTAEFVNKMKQMDLPIHGKSSDKKREILLSLPDEAFVKKPMIKH